jgi:MSHA biogenesis protein MshK
VPGDAEERLADPTAPPAAIAPGPARTAPAAAPLHLQSVLIDGARRIAVIDGRRVRVGDRVGGGVVAAIEPTEVRLDAPSGPVHLPLHRTRAKTRSGGLEGSQR